MLTEANLKEHLTKAYFIDSERKNIEVLYTSKDFKETHSAIIEYDTKHPDCQALLEVMSLDDLHESTYQHKKQERLAFEQEAIAIAKRAGLVFDYNKIDTKFFPALVKAIFEDAENEDHLFALKLAMFDIDKIKDSKNQDLKKDLRQAKNKLEIVKSAIKIYEAESN